MLYSKRIHREAPFEVVPMEDYDFQGIPEEEYLGQTIWDGEKLVTEEEWQFYQKQRQKRQFPWSSKQGQRDLNGHQWGKHCPPVLRFKRKAGHGHED